MEYLVTMTTHVPDGTPAEALPLYPYLRLQTTALTPHPSDPAAPGSRQHG